MTLSYIPSDTNDEGILKATASGVLPNGKPVVVNAEGTVSVVGGGNLTSENYIGISTGGTYADGSNATVKIIGNTSDEQSGLTAGQAYYVQTDGTLGTTPATPSVFAGTALSATKMIVKT